MKSFFALTATAAVMTLVSCGPSAEEIAKAKEQATADSIAAAASKEMTYTVDAAASIVNWKGNMSGLKSYSHFGTIAVNSGTIKTKGPLVTGGQFEINMKGINPLDSGYSAEHPKEGLIGHLSSGEFFAVDSFPTATFNITSVEGNVAKGDLTLRGKTNVESVTDIVITQNADGTVKATGKLVFDRQKYGVAWVAMKDMLLANNIELTVDLTGKAAQ